MTGNGLYHIKIVIWVMVYDIVLPFVLPTLMVII